MDLILSNNFLVNSLMLPGLYGSTTYTYDQYKPDLDDLGSVEETANDGRPLSAKQKYCRRKSKKLDVKGFPLRTIYIPFDTTNLAFADYFMNHPGDHIPAILQVAETNNAPFFVIHFHGNACDAESHKVIDITEYLAFSRCLPSSVSAACTSLCSIAT